MSDIVDDGFEPRFAALLERHLEKGLSLECFIGVVRFDLEIIKGWIEKYPEMKAAATFGDAKGRMMLEKLGLQGLQGEIKGFQFGVYKAIMEHRYDYGVKKQLKNDNPTHTIVLLPSNGRDNPKVVQGKAFGALESKSVEVESIKESEDNV